MWTVDAVGARQGRSCGDAASHPSPTRVQQRTVSRRSRHRCRPWTGALTRPRSRSPFPRSACRIRSRPRFAARKPLAPVRCAASPPDQRTLLQPQDGGSTLGMSAPADARHRAVARLAIRCRLAAPATGSDRAQKRGFETLCGVSQRDAGQRRRVHLALAWERNSAGRTRRRRGLSRARPATPRSP